MYLLGFIIITGLAGLVLMVLGLRGRVVGDDPHCKRCQYRLTGLVSNQCPECGAELTPALIRWGVRRKRSLGLGGGAMLTLVALFLVVGLAMDWAGKVNWYPHYPVWVLLRMGRNEDAAAIGELFRRFKATELPNGRLPGVVEVALQEHEVVQSDSTASLWADLLALVDQSVGLTEKQRDRFYSNVVTDWELVPRQRVREGDHCVFELQGRLRGSQLLNDLLTYAYRDQSRKQITPLLDDLMGGRFWDDLFFNFPGVTTLIKSTQQEYAPAGSHVESWSVTLALFPGERDRKMYTPLWQREFTVDCAYEIVESSRDDPIQFFEDELALGELPAAIRVGSVSIREGRLMLMLGLTREFGYCLAFDVVAEVKGLEYDVGQVFWEEGTTGPEMVHPPFHSQKLPTDIHEVELYLRSSRGAATEMMNCYNVLLGTVCLGPHPLTAEGLFFSTLLDDIEIIEAEPTE